MGNGTDAVADGGPGSATGAADLGRTRDELLFSTERDVAMGGDQQIAGGAVIR